MWNWIKWVLKIGWDCTSIHIDQERVGSNGYGYVYHIRMIETREYTNIKTGATRVVTKSYWA